MSNVTLYNDDCLIAMKNIPDKSVDLVLCDLPYGTTSCSWDVIIPFEDLWKEYKRVIKNTGVIALFGDNGLFTAQMVLSNKSWFKYSWVWCKNIKTGFLNAKFQPLKSVESISIFYKKSGQYYPIMVGDSHSSHHATQPGRKSARIYGNEIKETENKMIDGYYPVNIIKDIKMNASGRLHPSEKPIPLLEYLIKTYTQEGMMVLDNTMGSGSTGVACVNTNRDFVGIELDKNYFNIAKNRIEEVNNGPKK